MKLKPLTDKAKKIFDGWKNYAFPSVNTEKLAQVRAQICSECPQAVYLLYTAFIVKDKETKEIEGYVCDLCNCPLSAKIRSVKENCPDGRW